ncbi:hypothetical protein EVA_18529 [gut metagenome]|uniref:Transposase n=1 Tax=gut metagenome TaxID=749906 RepID=J9FFZ7_9ZZZZ
MRNEAAAEAEAKGRAEGRAEGKAELILKILARGHVSMEEIAEMTGLPLEEVRELAKKKTA